MSETVNWTASFRKNPLPWLLEEQDPAVRHLALRQLCDLPAEHPEVLRASRESMSSDPIAAMLAAQSAEGYWVKPGAGYGPKYTGTVWQLIFLDQLGADPGHPGIVKGCEYALSHTQTSTGGFGCSGCLKTPPPPSATIHCLHGNLLRALIGFGWIGDPRIARAIDWQARAITGEGDIRFYQSSTSGPRFRCSVNEHLPCAWGAVKALGGLARIPETSRSSLVQRAIETGIEFLLSVDPATAAYPAGWGNTKPSKSWFILGFPSGYVADVLQNLEVLCELGHAADPRLQPAVEWILSRQDERGRWNNHYAYNRKTTVDIEHQGAASKFVTLRVARVLKAVVSAGGEVREEVGTGVRREPARENASPMTRPDS